ncbi:hypothetical protein AC249_AIPGENE29207 [Exaiptasia diaphana]|nr:hypothetical protein AC249_AIPGENE29207 [Exaiptasia diaphana]
MCWLYLEENQKKDQDECSDYSDDFVESEDDIYMDDFEDDSPMNGSLKKPLPTVDNDNAEEDYPDDFEEDSDAEEVLGDILASARAAQEVEEEEELVEDCEDTVSCRQRLKEHFIDVLGGEKAFEDVCGQLENSSVEKTLAERPEFEKVQSGSNLMETCYLVNELFIENPKPES